MLKISEETMSDMVDDKEQDGDYQASCRKCSNTVTIDSFKDKLSLRMFNLGGICQECQDKVFDEDDDII